MRAACWHGTRNVRVEDVPEPAILNPRDAIVRVTSTAICGSDLHLYNGFFPSMRRGDVLGHEFMGEVIAVGSGVTGLREGDRVVVPCIIACGGCFFCKRKLFSCCDNSNPNQIESEKIFGYPTTGLFGYSHLAGGYAGGQAEMVRVPFADVGPIKIPGGVPDEKVLFLSDILPTGWMGAENCDVEPGDTVAVWGCGPVGQMAIRSLFLQGAERVIAIDRVPERLALAARAGAEPVNFDEADVYEVLYDRTGGRGPDACLDAVGMEAHGSGPLGVMDRVKQAVKLESDRPAVLREMIRCVRKGGTISVLGVYSGTVDHLPFGIAFNKSVTFRTGQVHLHRYRELLLDMILQGRIDPSEIISHTVALDDAAEAYEMFNEKTDGCTKIVMKPGVERRLAKANAVASAQGRLGQAPIGAEIMPA
jgi:threonine dehydrogenase-like Zn-dependent dehydrogenase